MVLTLIDFVDNDESTKGKKEEIENCVGEMH